MAWQSSNCKWPLGTSIWPPSFSPKQLCHQFDRTIRAEIAKVFRFDIKESGHFIASRFVNSFDCNKPARTW